MLDLLKRWRRQLDDRLRYSPTFRDLLSRWISFRQRRMPRRDDQERGRAIVRLCTAARFAYSDHSIARLQHRLQEELASLDEAKFDWTEFVSDIDDRSMLKAALLKPQLGPREKGVLFVSFENEWVKLLRLDDLRDFARRYTLVVSPSWSPHNLINYVFAKAYPEPFFTLISNPEDMVELPRVSDKLIVVPLFASNWVNPDLFPVPPRNERPYDLLMVGSFGKLKRQHMLFQALRRMPKDLRILLIGQHQEGRTAETIHQEARWYGVQDRYELRANQPYVKVVEAFGQARSSLVLSLREGSCVVVTESMFSDTPVALLHGTHLGSRVFINERTGRFLHERSLARQLTQFIREAELFQPRAWAVDHISCYKSSEQLNRMLKEHALRAGQEWTRDICPLQWAPNPRLVRQEDRDQMDKDREEIRSRYGLVVGYAADGRAT